MSTVVQIVANRSPWDLSVRRSKQGRRWRRRSKIPC